MLQDCWNQMLWIVLNKLEVNISTSSSKDNFYKHIKGMKLEFREWRWKINFEQSNLEELTSNMKPPHCCTRKCQKPSQLLNLWTSRWSGHTWAWHWACSQLQYWFSCQEMLEEVAWLWISCPLASILCIHAVFSIVCLTLSALSLFTKCHFH